MIIGFFDSGVGGLTILRAVQKRLPGHRYIYVDDHQRAPYGTLPDEMIIAYTREKVAELWQAGCQLIILACNTASSQALRVIQQQDLPKHPGTKVLGVLIPAAEAAVASTKNNQVGVFATQATVRSEAFVRELKKLHPGISVSQWQGSDLVPLIEAGDRGSSSLLTLLDQLLEPIAASSIDTLVLGCTHFEHISDHIRSRLPSCIRLIEEGRVVAEKLDWYLHKHATIFAAATGQKSS